MPEMILPGVYIEVRAEGLISPGRVTVGNIGMVGTASKGDPAKIYLLSSASEARDIFGEKGKKFDPTDTANHVTLVRSIELAFENGASRVYARRLASSGTAPGAASFALAGTAAGTESARLAATSPGTWGNELAVNVAAAEETAFIDREEYPGAATVTLKRKPIEKTGQNRVRVLIAATGETREHVITYAATGTPPNNEVIINEATGVMTFPTAQQPVAADKVIVSYMVPKANSRQVTIRHKTDTGETLEVFTAADGAHLVQLMAESALVRATAGANATEPPKLSDPADQFLVFTQGSNGGAPSGDDLKVALEPFLNEAVHIVVAAGLGDKATASALKAHCEAASTDKLKGDRISVVGIGEETETLSDAERSVESERVIFVSPGIKVAGEGPDGLITLPAAYTAAAVAGMLSALDPHISLTNKPVAVPGVEKRFTQGELTQLVTKGVFALEEPRGRGVRVVKGITATEPGTPFHQITTRRIVDFAKYGVRSAASPYIGRLNNERVRAALKSTVTSFLQEMLDDEMLVKFEVDVFASRADEIKGIANVTILLQPTFSIDFVKVTMILS